MNKPLTECELETPPIIAKEKEEDPQSNLDHSQSAFVSAEIAKTSLLGFTINFKDIKFLTKVGQGAFAKVYKASINGKIFAVKRLYHFEPETIALFQAENDTLRFLEENNIENVIHYYGYTQLKISNSYNIIMEYIPSGLNVFDWMVDQQNKNITIPWSIRFKILEQVALAGKSMHSYDVIHADFKWLNVLISNLETMEIKVADFGFAINLESQSFKQLSLRGTLAYLAPEISQGIFSKQTDVFAFSMMMYEMGELAAPFWETDYNDIQIKNVIKAGERPNLSKDCNEDLQLLIRQSWDQDRLKRPTMNYLFEQLHKLTIQESITSSLDNVEVSPRFHNE